MNYYSEFDPHAAAWLRELIREKLIPPGEVDERDIRDVKAADLKGFIQCHFFAGIGGWSHALDLADWDRDRPVWTGSCPCQPFSAAGKGKAQEDTRHLWPDFFRLIDACRPHRVFGEQVASAVRYGWWDDLCDDVEGIGYTAWACDLPACSIGSPTIRQRLFWSASRVSDTGSQRQRGIDTRLRCTGEGGRIEAHHPEASGRGAVGWLPGHASEGWQGHLSQRDEERNEPAADCRVGGLPDLQEHGRREGREVTAWSGEHGAELGGAGATGSFAIDTCDWLDFLDGKTRPIEPGLVTLVDGFPFVLADGRTGRAAQSRTGILKGIGNAIAPELAAAFIQACEGEVTAGRVH